MMMVNPVQYLAQYCSTLSKFDVKLQTGSLGHVHHLEMGKMSRGPDLPRWFNDWQPSLQGIVLIGKIQILFPNAPNSESAASKAK